MTFTKLSKLLARLLDFNLLHNCVWFHILAKDRKQIEFKYLQLDFSKKKGAKLLAEKNLFYR